MSNSQNEWPVLAKHQTKKWLVPVGKNRNSRHFVLEPGNAGFVLVHFATWYHRRIQPIDTGIWDDWGWAPRPIRGSSVISNHASGTAIDLNATKHPLGVRGTVKFYALKLFGKKPNKKKIAQDRIRKRLKRKYKGVIRWGGDYKNRADEMHYEINASPSEVNRVANKLRNTSIGRKIMRLN